jgi:RNA-directed DNA polymerase
VSPLLANIYLHELDRYMETNYLSMTHDKRKWRRRRGMANFLYARYADDWVVLCNGTKAEALAMKEELKGVLKDMGLTLSEEKTKVTQITEGFHFLGYRIIRSTGTSGKMVPKVLIPEKAIKRVRQEIKRMLNPHSTSESANAKIIALNQFTRGWCEYYRHSNNPGKTFHKLERELFWEMSHWLGKKYKISMPQVMQRFYREGLLGTKTRKLTKLTEYKAKRSVAKTWHNPYTEPEKVKEEKERIKRESLFSYNQSWNGQENRQGWRDLRDEVILIKGTVCALNMPDICESKRNPLHPSEVEVDHIIPRHKFKDPREADRMPNLQPVCSACHRAKTKADPKVLSRVR